VDENGGGKKRTKGQEIPEGKKYLRGPNNLGKTVKNCDSWGGRRKRNMTKKKRRKDLGRFS